MIRYKNIQWYLYHGALIPRVPPHININLTDNEAKELLSISKAYFVRYTNEWDRSDGMFWYIIKDEFNGMDELKSKYRTQIRRGFKTCTVRRASKEEIAGGGYNVYKKAIDYYNTDNNIISKEIFKEKVLQSNYENWAVYAKEDDRMIAYSQMRTLDGVCNSITTKFDPEYLRLRPSEALFYEVNKYYLEKKGYSYVSNGSRSISHETNIQDLLIQKLKFRKAYCKLNIHYRTDVKMIVNILYPFRKALPNTQNKLTRLLCVLLTQEEIRRSY